MADLPEESPFTNVGVDYCGPIEVKRGRSREMLWCHFLHAWPVKQSIWRLLIL